MDTNNFVLLASAFIVVATVMITFSQWHYVPTPKLVPHFACQFDSFCRGNTCADALPADVFVVPQTANTAAYMTDDMTAGSHTPLDTTAARAWAGRRGDTGMIRLRIANTGALSWSETASFAPESAILATATGQCRDLTATDREHG